MASRRNWTSGRKWTWAAGNQRHARVQDTHTFGKISSANANVMVVQYWRSFAHLHRYATDRDLAHLPAWKAFNRAIASSGDVGNWHEAYLVCAGEHESVYNKHACFRARDGRAAGAGAGAEDDGEGAARVDWRLGSAAGVSAWPVGWVERSETHQRARCGEWPMMGFARASTHPTCYATDRDLASLREGAGSPRRTNTSAIKLWC
jgi:Domain of unknown function (DUF4188)